MKFHLLYPVVVDVERLASHDMLNALQLGRSKGQIRRDYQHQDTSSKSGNLKTSGVMYLRIEDG